jgi:hypothetical protein
VSFAAIAGFAASIACASHPPPSLTAAPRPLEMWRVGDDSLTLRFSEGLREALRELPEFKSSRDLQPGTLVVSITNQLGWKEVGIRTKVSYNVHFIDWRRRLVREVSGSCWEDEMSKCVARVVKEARRASRELPPVPGGP